MNAQQTAMFARYRAALQSHRVRTAAALVAAWDRLEGHDGIHIPAFTDATAPVLAGAKAVTVATSGAFYGYLLGAGPVGVDPANVNVAPKLAAPFHAYWHGLSVGRTANDALAAGRSAVEHTGTDFVTSVARVTGDSVAATVDRPVRWERVPEAGACDWCIEHAGGSYASAEDADYGHERCFCEVVTSDI